ANIDEIYRGNIERNIAQVSRGYAENLFGFSTRLQMVGLSPKQSTQLILKHNAASYLEDEMSKCAVLIEYKNHAP
ncbi:MAG: hypothetical protein VXW87_01095, partial [Pseudomonadota bacterium]|nr:hypothetical protein [Pseudomonadota bacterium]